MVTHGHTNYMLRWLKVLRSSTRNLNQHYLLFLLSPHIFQIFHPSYSSTPRLLHHNTRELVVFHLSVIKVLILVPPLVIPKDVPDLCTNINLGVSIINKIIQLRIILLLTVTLNPPLVPIITPSLPLLGLWSPLLTGESPGLYTVNIPLHPLTTTPSLHSILHLLHF